MSAVDPKTPNSKSHEPNSKSEDVGIWFLEFGSWKLALGGVRVLAGPGIGLMVVLGVFIILFKIKGDEESLRTFLSFRNLQVLFHDITITGVISLGALLIIISGGIDLSVGSVAALVTVIAMQVFRIVYLSSGSMMVASLAAIPAGVGRLRPG